MTEHISQTTTAPERICHAPHFIIDTNTISFQSNSDRVARGGRFHLTSGSKISVPGVRNTVRCVENQGVLLPLIIARCADSLDRFPTPQKRAAMGLNIQPVSQIPSAKRWRTALKLSLRNRSISWCFATRSKCGLKALHDRTDPSR